MAFRTTYPARLSAGLDQLRQRVSLAGRGNAAGSIAFLERA